MRGQKCADREDAVPPKKHPGTDGNRAPLGKIFGGTRSCASARPPPRQEACLPVREYTDQQKPVPSRRIEGASPLP